ncbi:MAG: hypothetical protein SGPRY_008728, partial [Prymnesium sp.]
EMCLAELAKVEGWKAASMVTAHSWHAKRGDWVVCLPRQLGAKQRQQPTMSRLYRQAARQKQVTESPRLGSQLEQ